MCHAFRSQFLRTPKGGGSLARLLMDAVESADPHHGLGVLLGIGRGLHAALALTQPRQHRLYIGIGDTIGVVGLVVDHQQIALAAKVAQHAATERAVALRPQLHNAARAGVVLELEQMPVGDEVFALAEQRQHAERHDVEALL